MEEKTRYSSTPFPLQTVVGEKVHKSVNDGKFTKRFPITQKFSSSIDECANRKGDGGNQKILHDKKVSRKIFRDYKHDTPLARVPEKNNFYKTFTGGQRSGCNEWLNVHSQDEFIVQEQISMTQGFLHAVLHQPRLSTIDREVIIISLEGIIANYSQRELTIRSDAVSMLKEFHLRYQVVIISGWKLARFLKIISYLSSKGVYISAAYKQVGHGSGISEEFEKKRHSWYLDYSRIYKDFNINPENSKKVISITSLIAHPDDLVEPFYVAQYTGALRPIFMVSKAPIPTKQYPFTPLCVLVPHMGQFPVHLGLVTETVRALAAFKNFYLSVNSYKHPAFQLISTNILNKELLALYQKTQRVEMPQSQFLIFKSGITTEIFTLHKEKGNQTFGYESLLDFTLNVNN